MDKSFLIIGGDKRQEYLKNILSEKFSSVHRIMCPADMCKLDDMGRYSHIILPIPTTKDKEVVYCSNKDVKVPLSDIYCRLTDKQKLYGNGLSDSSGIRYFDFMKDETFKHANAHLTAQGALILLLKNTEDYIVTKKALILGFGDVARTLADVLSKLGVEVYIGARNKNQLLEASLRGYKTLKLTSVRSCIFIFDYIFGTIPSNVLKSEEIKSIGESAVYFELASYPFTADKENFKKYNRKHIDGSALPGRYLPLASAKLIADFILMNL